MGRQLYLFDLMDTVVADPFFGVVPAGLGLTVEQIYAVKDPENWKAFERGELDEAAYHAGFFRPEVDAPPFDRRDFVRAMHDGYRFVDGMEALLASLVAGGARLATASNYPIWYEVVRERLDLDRFFADYFVSCGLGVRKPDAAFYLKILEATGLPAAEVVFVDDRPKNVRAAADLGLEAILFEGTEALARRL